MRRRRRRNRDYDYDRDFDRGYDFVPIELERGFVINLHPQPVSDEVSLPLGRAPGQQSGSWGGPGAGGYGGCYSDTQPGGGRYGGPNGLGYGATGGYGQPGGYGYGQTFSTWPGGSY